MDSFRKIENEKWPVKTTKKSSNLTDQYDVIVSQQSAARAAFCFSIRTEVTFIQPSSTAATAPN